MACFYSYNASLGFWPAKFSQLVNMQWVMYPVISLTPRGRRAFCFKGLIFVAEDLRWFQWGSGRSKAQDPNECGNQQRMGFLSFQEKKNCCLYGIPELSFLLMMIAGTYCQTEWFLVLPNLHSNAKLWFWQTSYFINPLHIQLFFFNLTRLAVELMFKPVFYVFLMNLSEDITDEFRHLWIHVMVYEIKL